MYQKYIDLATLNGINGFNITGVVPSSLLGESVSTAGDLNADGIDDFVITGNGGSGNTGGSYVIFGSRNGFPASFNITVLNGTNGFSILPSLGTDPSASTAGDINGDGINDIVLGVGNGPKGVVIFGTRNGFPANFDLSKVNGINGFIVPLASSTTQLGFSVSTAGDINGDGISDLLFGALTPYYGIARTALSYIIFGNRNGFPAVFNLTNLNGTNGFTLNLPLYNTPGGDSVNSVSTIGDMNGDGIDDVVLGVPFINSSAGASYVIFGNRRGFPALFNMTTLNGTNGFRIMGTIASTYLGYSVTAGDINGDGLSDLLIGAPSAATYNPGYYKDSGIGYVIFGSRGGFPAFFNLTTLNGTNGFLLSIFDNVSGVPETYASLGSAVSTAGDINQDGISDIVVGAPGTRFGSTYGDAYVVFGTRSGFSTNFDVHTLNGTNGFRVKSSFSSIGATVSAADINGDAVNDLIFAAASANGNLGAGYVLFSQLAFLSLLKNELRITEGQSVTLSNQNLEMAGISLNFGSLVFLVDQVVGGRFVLVNNFNVAINNFTQTQIDTGAVAFISNRTAIVSYQVGIYNTSSARLVFPFEPATVFFTNNPPIVVNPPNNQGISVNEPFRFTFAADRTFNDTDGDPLTYSAQLTNGSALPAWLSFDSTQTNQLTFTGKTLDNGTTQVSLSARDPLNASVSTQFDLIAVPNNGTVMNNAAAATTEIIGGVVGGALVLAGLISAGLGFWRYSVNKTSRNAEQLADFIRIALNLKGLDNFDSEVGQKYVSMIHDLQKTLQEVGIDPSTMRPFELRQLADDVANAARNKISTATDCMGRSVITITDLNNRYQELVTEVQLLRGGGRQLGYTS